MSTAVCDTSALPEAATPKSLLKIQPHEKPAGKDNTTL
jgi:hypothetical protein